jgi:hypothetical protein
LGRAGALRADERGAAAGAYGSVKSRRSRKTTVEFVRCRASKAKAKAFPDGGQVPTLVLSLETKLDMWQRRSRIAAARNVGSTFVLKKEKKVRLRERAEQSSSGVNSLPV